MIKLTLDNNISTLEIYDLSLIQDVAVRVENGVELAQIITSRYDTVSVLASAKAVKKLLEYARADEDNRNKVYQIYRKPVRKGNEIQINETLTVRDMDSYGYGHLKILDIIPDQNMEEVFKEVKERTEKGVKNNEIYYTNRLKPRNKKIRDEH
jgi:hypothetical protein